MYVNHLAHTNYTDIVIFVFFTKVILISNLKYKFPPPPLVLPFASLGEVAVIYCIKHA